VTLARVRRRHSLAAGVSACSRSQNVFLDEGDEKSLIVFCRDAHGGLFDLNERRKYDART